MLAGHRGVLVVHGLEPLGVLRLRRDDEHTALDDVAAASCSVDATLGSTSGRIFSWLVQAAIWLKYASVDTGFQARVVI
jgi:hypothetical protein